MAVAGIAGGHDAIEEIHAPGNPFDDVGRSANPHQIAGLVFGHVWLHCLDDTIHHVCGLAHSQSP